MFVRPSRLHVIRQVFGYLRPCAPEELAELVQVVCRRVARPRGRQFGQRSAVYARFLGNGLDGDALTGPERHVSHPFAEAESNHGLTEVGRVWMLPVARRVYATDVDCTVDST